MHPMLCGRRHAAKGNLPRRRVSQTASGGFTAGQGVSGDRLLVRFMMQVSAVLLHPVVCVSVAVC